MRYEPSNEPIPVLSLKMPLPTHRLGWAADPNDPDGFLKKALHSRPEEEVAPNAIYQSIQTCFRLLHIRTDE